MGDLEASLTRNLLGNRSDNRTMLGLLIGYLTHQLPSKTNDDGPEAALNVAQALAISQLREDHRQILVAAGKAAVMRIAAITGNTLLKFLPGQLAHQLSKNSSSCVHSPLSKTPERRNRGAKTPDEI
jgi:hypothetical protein